MGEFTDGESPSDMSARDGQAEFDTEGDGFETDIEGVKAYGEKQGLPIFKVEKGEFYQNMQLGRRRIRFKTGTSAQQYMAGTKYRRAFWIEHEGHIRKIK
jgi:hypothetical protein